METRGKVRGQLVELAEPVPSLEGREVRVRLELLEPTEALTAEKQAEIWRQWVESGPQGPIDDDDDGWPA